MPGVGHRVAGRYLIARPLGSGGLGRVWLAVDEMLHRDVAIKQCAAPDGLAPDERELLRSWMPIEARAAGRVSHPNVIQIYDVLPGEDESWIVMEYVPSRSLLEVIKESGPLPVRRVAGVGLALLAGLDAAHRVGVLHLDVKPGNVLIADDGRVVLTDFGPAVTGEGIAALARRGMIMGSPNYVSPERLFDGVATAQADLWSLGATLYHAVEGRPPYVRETPEATMRALAGSAPDPYHLAGPLAGVLDGLLRRDPGARMTTVEAEDRLSVLAGFAPTVVPVPATRRPGPGLVARGVAGARTRTRARFRGSTAVVAAVCATLVLAGLAGAAVRRPWVDDGANARPARAAPVRQAAPPPSPFVLPRGYRWWDDPSGYSVAVPTGWTERRDAPGGRVFTAPGGRAGLRISRWEPGTTNLVAALIDRERQAPPAGYRRVRIEALPRGSGAVWEYLFRDRAAGQARALKQVVTVDGGTYLVEWHTPRSAWTANLQKLAVVLDSVRPLRGA
ncbi:serine/threonine-protein kinase [Amorphoplanes digitatis]|uniref:non-specific serine/threonine protein kinase n=1 Tax=Actinoplanes digitatis TaxID=1868 RepID=A0A7W7I022_9ACTN|nr:serine/threonine-protein kinase [Actinoplanes digitatis]MBB4763934.1 hypothetical protein [Actinoplanes digitatis]